MKDVIVVCTLLAVGGIIGALLFRGCDNPAPKTTTTVTVRDTVVVRDTVRAEIPVPRVVEVVRYDTVTLQPLNVSADSVAVALPVEQKEYVTPDYRAIIEGYKPQLVSMELYRQTQIVNSNTVTTITRQPRWAVTGGVGVGWTPAGVQLHLGVTVGYVIWSK